MKVCLAEFKFSVPISLLIYFRNKWNLEVRNDEQIFLSGLLVFKGAILFLWQLKCFSAAVRWLWDSLITLSPRVVNRAVFMETWLAGSLATFAEWTWAPQGMQCGW